MECKVGNVCMKKRIKYVIVNIRNYYYHVLKAKNNFKIPSTKVIKMKLKGFTPDEYVLYNLQKNNIKNYISEKERWYTRRINERYSIILDDKLIFYEVFKKYFKIPKNIFYIKENMIIDLNGNVIKSQMLKEIIKKYKALFLKPIIGGGGIGIFKVSFNNNYKLNDKNIKFNDLYNFILKHDGFVATLAIKQKGYANKIYPKSVNTIRIITFYDSNTATVNILEALHRFGTSKTKIVDNASSGGIFAKIDIQTGELSEARDYKNDCFVKHPDTKHLIKGVIIPNWNKIKIKCIKVAKMFPYIPYMAWDIVINSNEFEVIEINASTDLTLFQMFEGKRFTMLGKSLKTKINLK